MFFETQILPLSFISHFLKCSLRLKSILWVSYPIFKNVLWDSNPLFEFHITFFIMMLGNQMHYSRCCWAQILCLMVKLVFWFPDPSNKWVIWDVRFEIWDLRFEIWDFWPLRYWKFSNFVTCEPHFPMWTICICRIWQGRNPRSIIELDEWDPPWAQSQGVGPNALRGP